MEKKGYRFVGWYIDPERKKRINPGGRLPQVTTLYDKWIPILYPVHYKMNGGMNSRMNPRYISCEFKDRKLHPARKKGYIFVGWKFEGHFIDHLSANDHPIQVEAIFKEPALVMFVSNGGGKIKPKQLNEQSKIIPFRDPKRIGYEFDQWYFDSDFKQPFSFDMILKSSTILYAKWKIIEYSITYDYDGGYGKKNIESYTYDTQEIVFNPAYKEGFEFEGWYDQRGSKQEKLPIHSIGDRQYVARYRPIR